MKNDLSFNGTPSTNGVDKTLESLNGTYEILKGGLRGVYEAQVTIWSAKGAGGEQEAAQARQDYFAVRPEIDRAFEALRAGVETLNREIQQTGEQVKDDPKARSRLMQKQKTIAKSFLGNENLLGANAFKVIELPGGVEQPKKELPKFATKEEAMAYYAQLRAEKQRQKQQQQPPKREAAQLPDWAPSIARNLTERNL